jgi:hypothetical protein
MDRYFRAILYLGIFITIDMIITYRLIYLSIIEGEIPFLLLILIIVYPILLIIGFLLYLWYIYKQIPD